MQLSITRTMVHPGSLWMCLVMDTADELKGLVRHSQHLARISKWRQRARESEVEAQKVREV